MKCIICGLTIPTTDGNWLAAEITDKNGNFIGYMCNKCALTWVEIGLIK